MRTFAQFCLLLAASIALPLTALAQTWQSSTQGHTITSTGFPEGTIKVDEKLTYVGSDKWVLYGVADCEIHVFAETDADKTLKRLVWVQFEGYLPDKPHTYNYDKEPFRTELSGHTFFDRVTFRKMDPAQKPRAGSDTERVMKMLESKGIKLPTDAATKRSPVDFVWTPQAVPKGFRIA
ncbi:MAG: hypothetical protein SF172_13530 [Burkholderiales bacterium]|nr:hypothetical protein [Burkholderiales bacterium]